MVASDAKLRLRCLELSNLATNTANAANLPRGLLSATLWAVDVDTESRGSIAASRSMLILDNCRLVLTQSEFQLTSYYVAQSLASAVSSSIISSFLPNFRVSLTASALRWDYVSSPHTLWIDCLLTQTPLVFSINVPDIMVMAYLGQATYLTDLLVVHSCYQLLEVVSNASATAPAIPLRPPRAVVLSTNISIADCWPKPDPAAPSVAGRVGAVTVAAPTLRLMGLPDRTIVLDLGGREDAFVLGPSTLLTLRYLTLTGLAAHLEDFTDHDGIDDGAAQSIAAWGSVAAPSGLALVTGLLWAFQYQRRFPQLALEAVTIVLPPVELQQYDMIMNGFETMPYFGTLSAYMQANSKLDASYGPGGADRSVASGALNATLAAPSPLRFSLLNLPGLQGGNVTFVAWPGSYRNWSVDLYDTDLHRHDGGGWSRWQIAVLAALLAAALLAILSVTVLLGIRYHRRKMATGAADGRRVGRKRASRDIEAGGGGRCVDADRLDALVGPVAPAATAALDRRPLYDSFDDPAFELDFFKGGKPTAADVAEILERANQNAAEFNMRMTEILGSGSFGVVYGGSWHGLKVAIKTMVFTESPSPHADFERARQQCIRECAFCCTMHHPNVVAAHHFYLKSTKRKTMLDDLIQAQRPAVISDWRLYLIQEYCDGGTLRAAIDQGKLFRHSGTARGTAADAHSAALRRLPTGVSDATPTMVQGLVAAARKGTPGASKELGAAAAGEAAAGAVAASPTAETTAAAAALDTATDSLVAVTAAGMAGLAEQAMNMIVYGTNGEGGADTGGAPASTPVPISAETVTGGNGGDVGGGALGDVEDVVPILRCPCPRSSMPPLPPSTLQRPRTDPAMADSAVFSTDSNLLATSMTNVTNLLDEQNTAPSARSVVKELLRMERGIAAAAAATAATAATAVATAAAAPAGLADPPAGAVMALARPLRNHSLVGYGDGAANAAGGSDVIDDAALLLEDYDAAAAAVAAALARVTARPAAEGAPATRRAVAPPPRQAGQAAAAGEGGGGGSRGPVVPHSKVSAIQPADAVAAALLADAASPKRKGCNRAAGAETTAGAASPVVREAGDGAPAAFVVAAAAAAAASGATAGVTAARSPAATRPAAHAKSRKPAVDVMTLE
ncbi:hypothetical protein GPECTOR_123g478 [Gonium pectorale]|uniref:Protein kinase domain-containing protein n=1 Tax=Gonium pectorale TaxID=33097 RepID=A0A150FYL1_GONPE|nr:hypothetical protein GPECTOR_123g478 [Gonium pectorale]|eukprot:KXZ42706.1 hypothetical protein GPECTOR_123g478 [Gonium pectorale]